MAEYALHVSYRDKEYLNRQFPEDKEKQMPYFQLAEGEISSPERISIPFSRSVI